MVPSQFSEYFPHTSANQCSEYLRGTLLQISSIFSVQFSPLRYCYSNSTCLGLLGLLNSFSLLNSLQCVHWVPPGFSLLYWGLEFSEGSELGQPKKSLCLFPVSKGSLYSDAWCPVSWKPLFCMLMSFLGCFKQKHKSNLLLHLGWKMTALSIFISSVLIFQFTDTLLFSCIQLVIHIICWIYFNTF